MTLGTLIQRPVAWHSASRGFDRLIDDFYAGFGLAPLPLARVPARPRARRGTPRAIPRRFSPRLEARELETEYRVTAEVPGVDAKDLTVGVDGGVLTISGQRRYGEVEAATPASPESADEGGKSTDAVAGEGRFERRLRFPGEIVEADVTASYKNGVLTVTVPKLLEADVPVRNIPVETA